jgi:hypothetical protein
MTLGRKLGLIEDNTPG